MKRILYPFAGQSVGGSHISTALILKHLDRQKFTPVIVLEGDAPLQKSLMESHGLDVVEGDIRIPKSLADLIKNPLGFVKNLLKARAFLKKNAIDLIHCDDGPARYIWFYAAALAGVPYLHAQRTILKPGLEKTFALRRMAAVVANSERTKASLPAGVTRYVIAPLIELPPAGRARQSPENRVLNIGYLSNMYGQKRPDVFLEAASILHKTRPGAFDFVMAGAFYQGWEPKVKSLAADLGIADHVRFTGFVEKPLEVLEGFDLLIAPAEHEAFGRVLVEAMTLGVPVIAARDGGHIEIIRDGENGFLCVPGDAQEFAAKALSVLDNKALYENFSQAGLDTAKTYDAENLSKKFQALYDQIPGERE
ncbi:MAG TPA: glycosyltransferase family 4 protein [Alphaproteobacteria bacterium]|nr:glycosyltransferase family 4 protein [Alphaproteobacteria bacterium]